MNITPKDIRGLQLFHEGTQALSEVEHSGIRIDTGYLDATRKELKTQIKADEKELFSSKEWKIWLRRFGQNANIYSNQQLGTIVYKELGMEVKKRTEKGTPSTDEEAFEGYDSPFITKLIRCKKRNKALTTYLDNIRREVSSDGLLHPVFNLNTVITYRSCVAKGTLVEIVRDVSKHPKGVPIECVQPGDVAYCYDDKCRLTLKKVLWAGKTGHRNVIRLHWSARGKKGYLDVTPEHKIRMASGVYVRADRLLGCDFRKSSESKRNPKVRCLALGRSGDHIYETGNIVPILDHRFVFEQLSGINLKNEEVIHHVDGNHLNNTLSNLEKHTRNSHGVLHSPTYLTDKVRKKARLQRMINHDNYGGRWKSGEQASHFKFVSKYQFLRMLAQASGRSSLLPLDFEKVKQTAERYQISLKKVKDRYDRTGVYISRGRLLRAASLGRDAVRKLGIGFYKVASVLEDRGVCLNRRWANQFGAFTPNNHKIIKIEVLSDSVDVYDLEVEEHHNFIAGEICVHNSSENPNFQNMPIRDPEMGKMIRRAFIPRPGCVLLENDFKGLEVGVSACYNKDPNLISYIKDPTKDMHRDMAAQLYMLKAKQVSKKARYGAKNKYVFPEFYGSFWAQCAPALWEWVDLGQLMVEGSDVSVRDHLTSKGITELGDCSIDEENGIASPQPGTFAHHVMQVEKDFWGNRFKVYARWKRDWYDEFLRKGYFDTYTGFRLSGEFKRNEAVNYPIQGSGFHCLLWTLIHTLKAKRRAKMKSLVIGQIHDSMLSDIPVEELDDFSAMVNELVSVELPRVWDWIIVPMQIETEICAPGCTWYDKKEVHYKDGIFSLDDKQLSSKQLLQLLQQKVKAST